MSDFTDESIMPFGKHKGKKLCNVPSADLKYYYEDFLWKATYGDYGRLKDYCEDNAQDLKITIVKPRG